MTIEILGGPTSTCCNKVHLTALEKGQEIREVEVEVWKHQNLKDDYIRLNRDGMVPTVLHEGMVFVESTVIIRYLDRRFPEPPLTPSDPLEAMRMDLLMKDLDEKYHSAIAFLSFSEGARDLNGELTEGGKIRLKSFDKVPEPKRREQRRNSIRLGLLSDEGRCACGYLETMIKDMDAALKHGPFLAGHNYSLADASLTPYLHRLWILGCEGLWESDYPQVGEWYERIKARRSFTEVITKYADKTRQRKDPTTPEGSGTWNRFQQALALIKPGRDELAVRLPARIWSIDDVAKSSVLIISALSCP